MFFLLRHGVYAFLCRIWRDYGQLQNLIANILMDRDMNNKKRCY